MNACVLKGIGDWQATFINRQSEKLTEKESTSHWVSFEI